MRPEAKICPKCRALFGYDEIQHVCSNKQLIVLQPLYSKWQLESLLQTEVEIIIATINCLKSKTSHATIHYICDAIIKLIRSKEFVKSKLKSIDKPILGNTKEMCQYCGENDDLQKIVLLEDSSFVLVCCCCRHHLKGKFTVDIPRT